MEFGTNLKWFRKNRRLNQTQLAGVLGVNQRTISAWERGVCEPDLRTLIKLRKIFNVSIDALVGGN